MMVFEIKKYNSQIINQVKNEALLSFLKALRFIIINTLLYETN